LLTKDFMTEYQNAVNMVCQGHCSGGIKDSLDHMRDIVNNAMTNINSADSNAQTAISGLSGATSAVTTAQQQVNQSGGTSQQAQRQLVSVQQIASDISRASQDLLGSPWSSAPSLNRHASDLDQFSSQGCVSPN
jgi:ABC-type transporter Mla subunit MlaD